VEARRPGPRRSDAGPARSSAALKVDPDLGEALQSWLAIVIVTMLLVALPAASASANGGTLRLSRVTAGPYDVSAWTQPQPPRVGHVDLSVAVMFPDSGKAVPDGEVRAIARQVEPHGPEVQARLERGAGGNVLLHHAVLELPAPGRWRVIVEVAGPSGAGSAAFEIDVLPALPFVWLIVIGFAVAALVVAGWWVRKRRAAMNCATELQSLALVALGILSTTAGVQTFDPSRYQPSTLEAIAAQYPGRRGMVLTPDVPVRVHVTYTGRFRGVADDTRRVIEAWSASMASADMAGAFRRELDVEQRGQRYWLAVQEVLVPQMEGELRPGEAIELFVIYIGQVDRRPIFLINAFDHEHRNDPRR
jgi:membrane protein implicated in regulation of membrane protease activity